MVASFPSAADVKRSLGQDFLAHYVEQTSALKLHRWQREDLCPKLDLLGKGLGKRYIIHAPPQVGKSILLTKRLPAKLLGNNPLLRVAIAAYNVTHATRLTRSSRNAMWSPEHKFIFPDPMGHVPEPCAADEFSTYLALGRNEGQPSMAAYGLNSGFTGNGVDVLLIDDPYASPDEAMSETINESTWRWWDELASVRVNEQTDVVGMFHRYHLDDLAGRLLATGDWEYLRFPAIGDNAGDDPTRRWRGEGEPLSPIRTLEYFEAQKAKNPRVFSSQFQGVPQDAEGALFTREMFQIVERRPYLPLWMRAIDPAGGVKEQNDETATGLVGIDHDQSVVIDDVTHWRRTWPKTRDGLWMGHPYADDAICTERGVVQIMRDDLEYFEEEARINDFLAQAQYLVGYAKKGLGLPMYDELSENELVSHVPLYPVEEGKSDKLQKASVWAAKAYIRPIRLVRGAWNEEFIQTCLAFRGDGTTPDDMVDMVSIAMLLLRMIRGTERERDKQVPPGSQAFYDALREANRG